MSSEAFQYIITKASTAETLDPKTLKRIKVEASRKFDIPVAKNADILAEYKKMIHEGTAEERDDLWHAFSKRKIRNLSGVAVITVLTKPYYCPGRCVYCPTEARMPKSYLANEPGAARALRHEFDPYEQVHHRLKALHDNGHSTDKCELIILGGTWTVYKKDYQEWFIKRCFDAFNEEESETLDEAKTKNETAPNRVIGMTMETRPDHTTQEEAKRLRWLGATRVQLGVQTTDQAVLDLIKRDQTNEQVIEATRTLKEAGFKISHHYMQGLPGATVESDVRTIHDAFFTPDYQPDHIKIYPTVVVKTAVLYRWWKEGKYKPYTEEQLVKLLIKINSMFPEWTRVERLIRDIPSESIHAGNKKTNLRQILESKGRISKDIRAREPHSTDPVDINDLDLVVREYEASGGTEYFISFESKDRETIYAFTRLRLQQLEKHWYPVLQDAALIREVHTYGKLKKIASGDKSVQHIGLGQQLIKKAEEIATENGYKKMAIIAGIGVREYFKNKLGYHLEEEYMMKEL